MYFDFLLTIALSQQLAPVHLYNNKKNGIIVDVEITKNIETAQLVLCDADFTKISNVAAITSGTHDITRRIPEIQELTRPALLQLCVDGKSVGTPIWIQPLLSREIPIVEEAIRPNGETKYTKIIDWENEAKEDGFETPIISGWRVYKSQDAIFETSKGEIHVRLRPDAAPNTAWNFMKLVNGGFYNNTVFHRIVPMTSKGQPFVIQGGDPTGTGSGGPGYWLPIENSNLPHDFGVLSMARASDPDSAGSQFFFCLSREGTARLDGQYCAFGTTISGGEVIESIAAVQLANPSLGTPQNPPLVNSIELVDASPISICVPSRVPREDALYNH